MGKGGISMQILVGYNLQILSKEKRLDKEIVLVSGVSLSGGGFEGRRFCNKIVYGSANTHWVLLEELFQVSV